MTMVAAPAAPERPLLLVRETEELQEACARLNAASVCAALGVDSVSPAAASRACVGGRADGDDAAAGRSKGSDGAGGNRSATGLPETPYAVPCSMAVRRGQRAGLVSKLVNLLNQDYGRWMSEHGAPCGSAATLVPSSASASPAGAAATAATSAAAAPRLSARWGDQLCQRMGLKLRQRQLFAPTAAPAAPSTSASAPAAGRSGADRAGGSSANPAPSTSASVLKALQPLSQVLQEIQELRLAERELRVREAQRSSGGGSGGGDDAASSGPAAAAVPLVPVAALPTASIEALLTCLEGAVKEAMGLLSQEAVLYDGYCSGGAPVMRDAAVGREAEAPVTTAPPAGGATKKTSIMQRQYGAAEGGTSGGDAVAAVHDIRELASWLQPLLRLTGELLATPSLAGCLEEGEEMLRRVRFDVDVLRDQQQQAISDGDMKTAEELYFSIITQQESEAPLLVSMEALVDAYEAKEVREATAALHTLHAQASACIGARLRDLQEGAKGGLVAGDLAAVEGLKGRLQQERAGRVAEVEQYVAEWERAFRENQQQQDACLLAMEEVEKRLRNLAEEQRFLVEDRLRRMQRAREEMEAGELVRQFAEEHAQRLACAMRLLSTDEAVTDVLDAALAKSCGYLETHLTRERKEAVVEAVRLQLQRQRLGAFRGLYLTLGDLQYKKERHLEELEKKIEYMHIQQELAMESLNPKAKEFSSMKKEMLQVKEETTRQLEHLRHEAQLQIEGFKPVERLLLAAGVTFTSPVEELEARNQQRQQKLLEYQQLMETTREEAAEQVTLKEMEAIELLKTQTLRSHRSRSRSQSPAP